MRPAFSRTRRCLEMAGSEMENGLARSVTQHSVRARSSRIRRRVGSDNAPKTASSEGSLKCLTIWLSIAPLYTSASRIYVHGRAEPGVSTRPTTHNRGSRPFSCASPDRAGARRERVPTAQLRITSLPRATPGNFCSNLSSFSSVQLFDEKEACRNQEHRNQARCKHSSDHRRPHHLPGNGSGT